MTELRNIAIANQDFEMAAFIRDMEDAAGAGKATDYAVLKLLYERAIGNVVGTALVPKRRYTAMINYRKTYVEVSDTALFVGIDGYGDAASAPGYGTPVVVDFYEEEPKVAVWSDIAEESPTHTISLEGAKESEEADL